MTEPIQASGEEGDSLDAFYKTVERLAAEPPEDGREGDTPIEAIYHRNAAEPLADLNNRAKSAEVLVDPTVTARRSHGAFLAVSVLACFGILWWGWAVYSSSLDAWRATARAPAGTVAVGKPASEPKQPTRPISDYGAFGDSLAPVAVLGAVLAVLLSTFSSYLQSRDLIAQLNEMSESRKSQSDMVRVQAIQIAVSQIDLLRQRVAPYLEDATIRTERITRMELWLAGMPAYLDKDRRDAFQKMSTAAEGYVDMCNKVEAELTMARFCCLNPSPSWEDRFLALQQSVASFALQIQKIEADFDSLQIFGSVSFVPPEAGIGTLVGRLSS